MCKKYIREPDPRYKTEDIKLWGSFIILSKLNPSDQLKKSKFQFNKSLPKYMLFHAKLLTLKTFM